MEQITVVEPEQTDALAVEPGRDLVTLLTCTPYGVNSHRLLVRGFRVDFTPELVENEVEQSVINPSLHTNYLLWVVVGLGVTLLIILLLIFSERRKKRKLLAKKKAEEERIQAEE